MRDADFKRRIREFLMKFPMRAKAAERSTLVFETLALMEELYFGLEGSESSMSYQEVGGHYVVAQLEYGGDIRLDARPTSHLFKELASVSRDIRVRLTNSDGSSEPDDEWETFFWEWIMPVFTEKPERAPERVLDAADTDDELFS